MSGNIDAQTRRSFIGNAALALGGSAAGGAAFFGKGRRAEGLEMGPSDGTGSAAFAGGKQISAGQLDVGYFEFGPADGPPVLLLHGFPYDVHSYVDVAPLLAGRGCRVIVPHLRGHGCTRFLDGTEPRSGQQGAIGSDVIDGDADGVVPATDGKLTAPRFRQREHRVVPGVGHNLPQEAPVAFAEAVLELAARVRPS